MARGKKIVKYYGTGRRKTSIARVWLLPGEGRIQVNDKPWDEYFGARKLLEYTIRQPFEATSLAGQYDVVARANGGGSAGQAGAIRHGIANALLDMDPGLRPILRKAGFLTRDPRVKERKKYGHKRARKSFQFSKR